MRTSGASIDGRDDRPVSSRIFIASSQEHLKLARGIQSNLHHDFETTVWDQDVLAPSEYRLESLARQLEQSDFGVFVLAASDCLKLRGDKYTVPRDNVLFELGMFAGKLGRTRVFILVPESAVDLHLPTDLLGLQSVTYRAARRDANLTAALGPACNTIRDQICKMASLSTHRTSLVPTSPFSTWTPKFHELIANAHRISLCFIHSRRWRENHEEDIRTFLNNSKTRLDAYLPNLANRALIKTLSTRFNDGPYIREFVADAYWYFANLLEQFPRKVRIWCSDRYPAYSFYVFDKTVICAMYPNASVRCPVPTFSDTSEGVVGRFCMRDIKALAEECTRCDLAVLRHLARRKSGR